MEILCGFEDLTFRTEKFYGCFCSDVEIPEDQDLKFIGQHVEGKANNDVLMVGFRNCTVTKVPRGLTKIFPNLKILCVINSKMEKISKNDLTEYKNLEKFLFRNNDFVFLPGDLFEDFNNLEFVSFSGNKLEIIEPNILDGLEKLNHVKFSNNPNYTKCYSIYPNEGGNATLEELKDELYEKLFLNIEIAKEFIKKYQRKMLNSKAEMSKSLFKIKQEGFFGDIKKFTQNEKTKDFNIFIDDREFPVHKFLLAARSPTLAEILRNNPEVENLNLVDISVEIFEKVLKFLYTDELPREDGTNFLHLFAAAGKLKTKELKNFAALKLIDRADAENALEILTLSNKYVHDELRQKAFSKIKEAYPKHEFKDEWAKKSKFIVKIIEEIKRSEEAMRKLEEEFKNLSD